MKGKYGLSDLYNYLANLISTDEDRRNGRREVYAYGIEALFSLIYNFIPLLIYGYISNNVMGAVLMYITFSMLRVNGGGQHCHTRGSCFITTQFFYLTSFSLALLLQDFSGTLIIFSLGAGLTLVPIVPKPSKMSPSRGYVIDSTFKERFLEILIILFILSVILNGFGLHAISSSISFGIIAIKILLADKTEDIIEKIWEVIYSGRQR